MAIGRRVSTRGRPPRAHPTILGYDPADPQPRENITYDKQVASIENYLLDHDLTDVVLVGHSYGGVIISSVAANQPDRIGRLVFQNALVVADGNRIVDETP